MPNQAWITSQLDALCQNSNTEVSDVFGVHQSRGKLFFIKPSCCVSAQKMISVDIH